MKYRAVQEAIRRGEADRVVPDLCRQDLDEIASGRWPLQAVRHPLGFICLPVERDGDLGVCVHLWSHIPEASTSVHSHSWDLLSFVLYGWVGNTVITVVDDPVDGTHRLFEVRSIGDVDEVRATPRLVRWAERAREVSGPGRTYRLRAGEFHQSVIEGDLPAATVVLGRTSAAADLSLGPLGMPTHRVVRQRCGLQETAAVAAAALATLETARSSKEPG